MRRFVNGDEVELDEGVAEVGRLADRLTVRTEEGSHTAVAVADGDAVLVSYKGRQYRVERKMARRKGAGAAGSGELVAPMPGQIVDVRVAEGDIVKKGETLLVLEAMKTQQPFIAPFDGVVKKVGVAKGDQVVDGALLAQVKMAQVEAA
jgi:acetyl/propionyl-CoA carboxylase alpha subunit